MTELEKLLSEVTPGEWSEAVVAEIWIAGLNVFANTHPESSAAIICDIFDGRPKKDASLMAMAPALARKVIATEKLVEALAEVAADLALGAHPELHKAQINEALAAWEDAQ